MAHTGGAARTRRSGLAAAVALCALVSVAAVPGPARAAASGSAPEDLPAYRTAAGARHVSGAPDGAGPVVEPGFYTDDIGPGERKHYRVALDDTSDVWISVVALPEPGSAVGGTEGIEVELRSADGDNCGESSVDFGSGESARPIADHAWRMIRKDGYCQEAGEYVFAVERRGARASGSSGTARWPLEIRFMREPGLRTPVDTSPPPAETHVPPGPPSGRTRALRGGTGFNDAAEMGEGNWSDALRPGETRFYKVPLDWGQRLFTEVEFGAAGAGDAPYVGNGLRVDFYNTARGRIGTRSQGYQAGRPARLSVESERVAYANRYALGTELGDTRFAGWYYIAVHAHEDLAGGVDDTVPLVLRTTVEGEPQPGPEYDGDAVRAGFGVTEEDREAAASGRDSAAAPRDGEAEEGGGALRMVGWVGIGTGTALLAGLGLWTFLARRGAAQAR
ncbi:hypothetical protein F0L17_12815 [Streptomyces sp. TRM43335]|uniref:Uncharacterized protein n=1 Tax=Streptomyces taklimakanensis TaxID=2569853 RepID=A0A6G2BDK2_9ACTN|nr:hypothetical protein [Streptomyces taklimakanensis]MTE19982.1 hypothetical protein [Streptomyces taklimakanensis]